MSNEDFQKLLLDTMHEMKRDIKSDIASLSAEVKGVVVKNTELDNRLTTQETEFKPVRNTVYGGIRLVLVTVACALLYLVVGGKK